MALRKRNLIRDFLVYLITSFQKLFLKGEFLMFANDILVFRKWWKYKTSSKDILAHRIPWITFDAIDFLKKWLKKDMIVYEYGSGGSTLFISDYVQMIYSVEHDEEWFYKLKTEIEKEKNFKINYQLFKPVQIEVENSEDCSNPKSFLSCIGQYKNFSFVDYVKSINKFEDNHFDLIIVDGRARPSCILHSIEKLKKGGILLVDNTDRAYYLKPFPDLFNKNMWKQKTFQGHTPFGLTSVLYSTSLFTKK